MKKISYIIFVLICIFMISGCEKTKKLTCEGISPGTNMNAVGKIEYIFENDKLVKLKSNVVFQDITIDNLENLWDSIKEQITQQNEPVDVPGFKKTLSSDDKNYTFTVATEIDFNKLDVETMEKYDLEDISNKTIEEIKTETEEEGIFTCKITK